MGEEDGAAPVELGPEALGDLEIVAIAGSLAFGSTAGIGAANVTLLHNDNVVAFQPSVSGSGRRLSSPSARFA